MKRVFSSLWLLALSISAAQAQDQSGLPQYDAGPAVPGSIRMHGDDYAATVVKAWVDGFQARHPEAKVQVQLLGTGTGLAGLYSNTADMALIGHDLTPYEHDAYKFAMNKLEPYAVEVMTGSLATPGKAPAVVAFVHKDNPIENLTLAQLDAIVGTEHRRGLENIRTWGQLGLTGEWAQEAIRTYVYDAKTGTGNYFNLAVLKDSSKWNWGPVKEFTDIAWNHEGFAYDAGQQIVDALSKDRYGLGISSMRYATAEVRALPLAEKAGGPFFAPTRENLVSRKYPLTRAITMYVTRDPKKPLDPKVKAFLEYALSAEGQAAVASEGQFLPLSPEVARAQWKKLQ